MFSREFISIECPTHLHHPGSTVSGQLRFDVDKARDGHLEECLVELRGVVDT
jgi:hypothetical protein